MLNYLYLLSILCVNLFYFFLHVKMTVFYVIPYKIELPLK